VPAIIRSFKDRAAEAVFNGRCLKGFPADIFRIARRKLQAMDAAANLNDLRAPPNNRLEALKGDRERPTLDPHQRPVAHMLPMDRRRPERRRNR
jgi:hypothetical protein